MTGAVPLLALYAFMAWTETALLFMASLHIIVVVVVVVVYILDVISPCITYLLYFSFRLIG
jgi:hypothetical protein